MGTYLLQIIIYKLSLLGSACAACLPDRAIDLKLMKVRERLGAMRVHTIRDKVQYLNKLRYVHCIEY